jgi:hypothetical protein
MHDPAASKGVVSSTSSCVKSFTGTVGENSYLSASPLAGVFIPALLDKLSPARGRLRTSLSLKVRTTWADKREKGTAGP